MGARMRTVTMRPPDSTTSVGSDSWNRQNQLNGMPQVEARVWTRLSAVVGLHLVDALLVLVPLFFRDQQLGQGPVDAFHQGIGRQPGAEHQLAGAVQQAGRAAPAAAVLRRPAASSRCAGPDGRLPGAADDAHQIGPAGGKRIPAGAGDPAQGGQQLGVLHGGAGGLARRRRPRRASCWSSGKAVQRLVDPERGRERQAGLPAVEVSRHRITTLPWPARHQSASSTITGAWSEAPLPLRSSRSIDAPVTRAARAGEARTKSIRMPSFLGKRSWV